jgi:flagellar basal-body rod modification protein FlgD
MAIGNLTGVNTTSDIPTQARETGSSTLGQDTFLRLLTTQLQNQDPTNPVSNEQFVAQLAQFSQLEQLQGLSGKLDNIAVLNASMNNAAMTNLLGQTVVAKGDTVHYDGEGPQELHYDASGATTSATLTVTDADGHVVYSADLGALPEGEGTYSWDGRGLDGSQLPEGDYTFSIGATAASGDAVDVQTLVRGVVDEMDFSTGAASPSVDGVRIDMADILRLDDGRSSGA